MEGCSILETIQSRRSVRRFQDKPVAPEHLEQMLEAARLAPSGGNLQGWRFIVLKQRELIAQLAFIIREKIDELPESMEGCIENSQWYASALAKRLRSSSLFFEKAPAVIAVLYKLNPYNKPYLECLIQKGFDRHQAHQCLGYVEVQSVAAATQNLILTAHSLGYGCCWMNVPFIAVKEIKEVLDVSSPWEISAFVPVGYPHRTWTPSVIPRKRLDQIVSYR